MQSSLIVCTEVADWTTIVLITFLCQLLMKAVIIGEKTFCVGKFLGNYVCGQ
jgi:hypothetical protein